MAGSRGYRSYRGKGSKKKIVLAVILLLVILAALSVTLLQKQIVYDETGAPRLEVPWQEEVQESEEVPELDLVIQPVEKAEEPLRGISIPVGVLTAGSFETVLSEGTQWNGVAVTLKDSTGTVYCDLLSAAHNSVSVTEDTAAAFAALTASELHTIARISCFHDPKAANADVEGLGLKNTGGYIFYDGNNSQWLDPTKPAARQYLCEIAKAAAELGFREILLADVSYPTEGKVDKIAYGEGPRQEHLRVFLQEMRTALEAYQVKLSVEVPADVLLAGGNELAGLMPESFVPAVDRVYAAVLPEQAEACEAVVGVVDAETEFIPVLETAAPADLESYLIR